ncbi:MAG TPA: hypothetical protein VJ372_05250 [Pyrinomonadaceae bacterium]|jgi:hypothetical protein|nr:hypothetical protein [Pyrinomonadaceae bacterium]
MRLFLATLIIALAASFAFGQAPTLRIVSDDGNKLPSELFYGNIKVKPLRLRPGTNVPITINDADFFVNTQYVDFLSRFPDQSGFTFWTNDITVCGSDPACTEVKRINVSAAFFVSIEFQQTGYLVYKMYEAGFGTPSNSPVPVRREDFMPDTRTISTGVVVGQQGWEGVLDANKHSFALAFVQRPAFSASFPASLTAQQFVDQLDNNVGNVLSGSEKSDLVGVLGGTPADSTKRASVLLSIAENSNLSQRDFNKAFVLMQYFGYLRRNPNDSPDTNFDGYNFWLGKLNQFNGNYIQAEMVKAFIASNEYLNRF